MSTKALPWQENVEEELSEKAGSQYADEGHASEDDRSSFLLIKTDSSLQFNDEPEDIDSLRQAGDDSGLTSHGSFSNPSDLYNDEWGFIRRPQYYGHDRDPVLQKFLRKLYLNFTSSTDGRAGPVVPIHMNPPTPLNKNFFGRDHALAMIKAELCPKNSIKPADGKGVSYPLTFAICAPGGMGKTQVAIQFAHLHRKDFDIILWVNAASTNEMAQGFQRIALLLDLVPETSVDANDLLYTREMVKRWLVNPRGRENDNERKPHKIASWLLIYDGIQDPDILNDYWPYDGPGSILITSRNPFSWTKSLPLQPFSSEEAISFLLRLTGRELSEVNKDSLLSVSKRLGGLPLALTQMASIIVMKQLSFKQFLDSYNEREGQRELLQFQIELKSLSYQHTVASVWAFENLKHGRQLLNVLSMIDPDSIPERILTSTMREINLPGYPKTVEEYERARGELLACSLVTGNKHEHKLSIHRLVQDVTRARMGHGEFRQTLVACVDLIASIWPFESFAWRHGIARWSSCEELFPHIASLKDLFPTVLASSGTSNDYHLARLLTDAGWYLHERGQPIESNLFNNMAQSICESLKLRLYEKTNNSYEHDVTHVELDYTLAEIYHNRGCTASEANDAIEAMKNFQIFHNMMQDKLGKRPQRTDMRLGIACNELGNAYMLEEDWVEGEKYFRRSINLLQELDDFEPVSISLPMVNLGYAFWLQGKLAEATEVLEKGVDERKARYGIDDRISFISGRFYHALGNVAYDQGFLEKSLNYHHKALLHYKSTLGNNHHRTASVFVKVAEHNMRAHQYDTAIALLDHALKVYSMSNIYVPEKTRALFKKSRALRCLHLLEESEKELQTCFRVYLELIEDKNTTLKRQQVPKGRPEDLIDGDFDNLVAFWSK
ncbi:tetratricopeptide repeat domain-containing protein [Phlyctema vagabunda]|uniref:Tetratricopeptide repeat domain-containing protein n=1 Tax=Phlyctema vagabunda TaxID=108571 RepID=A0ABR4PU81_9HELO